MSRDKPYKTVVIFGPDHNGSFESDLENAPKGHDCLVIGDGKRDVTLDEIGKALAGKINEATCIHICAHGGVEDLDPTGVHAICLDNTYLGQILPTLTSSLFKTLSKASKGIAVYVHLHSCYAGNADNVFSCLPEGSMVVLHSSKNTASVRRFDDIFSYSQYNSTAVGAKKHLLDNLQHLIEIGGAIKFNKSGKEYTIKYVIPEIEKAQRGYLDFVYQYFHKIGEEYEVLATEDVEQDLLKFTQQLKAILELEYNEQPLDKFKLNRDFRLLTIAIIEKNYSLLDRLVNEMHININSEDASGKTLFSYAKDKKTVQILVKYGADVNHRNKFGWTPLIDALSDKSLEVVEALLEAGARPNLIKEELGMIAIFYAKDKKTVQTLVKYGADVNHRDKYGVTPLMHNLSNKSPEVVEALLEAGAKPNLIEEESGRTAIFYAKDKKNYANIS